ncbi:Lipopolysaccharide core biosynthesis glycosyltransferase lpsD [invertebrate metagenome]|uniref:Lipopolysaccharide core biosynthesis glycosyltransferase lpsD n=1 Tax=invertebrate metagenome TaxID=1711999 RepID=A0A484H5C2_9ZZZZ
MTRVLQAMAGAVFGGAEAFFVRLVLALHRAGVSQHVIIRAHTRRAAILEARGLSPVELPFGGPFDVKSRLRFRREIARFQPDVVLTWMNRATQLCPRGSFIHVGRLGGYYDLKFYRHCDHLIGNTHDIVDYIVQQGWPRERAHYLPNFVNEERCPPLKRMTYYTPDSAPLILALGRLHKNKGFHTLLKAMTGIPEVYLWVAGAGPQHAELEALATHLAVKPRVRFLGWQDDVAPLFAAADLFVCTSRHEPLGNVILEAWAQGLPVVATASAGPAALIRNEENGLLTPVDEAPALALAIRRVLLDDTLRQRLTVGGRLSFEATFTETAVVAHYRTFFNRITSSCVASAEQ